MTENEKEAKVEDGEAPAPVTSADAEVLDEEPRNLLIALISEIRIGMDLSRIPLPTFVLEPRSMLEKLTDFMTHGELLTKIPQIPDPVERLVGVVKWYLSGFYIKPQGVKKPYNPTLGEFFRCKWELDDGTTTHYVAEQVSHHPPISSFYVSNRKAGFIINGSLAPRSKFFGHYVASYLDGTANLVFLDSGESYSISFPSAYARGILFGTLLMELCGEVFVQCNSTQCRADIEFKAKPFFGGEYNCISAKIKKKKDTLYSVNGKWDGRIDITNLKTKQTEMLWDSNGVVRIPKIFPPIDHQENTESQKLWNNVTVAIKKRDQREATAEKTKLEEAQRKERNERTEEWVPRLFRKSSQGEWIYRYINTLPYTDGEIEQQEEGGIIYYKGPGKQFALDAEARNFKAYAERPEALELDKEKKEKDKKSSRSFSTGFLRGSTGSSSGEEKSKK